MKAPDVKDIVRKAGGPSALARALGDLTPAAVSMWKQVPPARVGKVAEITGISLHELRPDLFSEGVT